jgi:hypothetical protein
VFEDAIAGANSGKPFDDCIGANLAIRTDFYVIFDDGCRVYGHF